MKSKNRTWLYSLFIFIGIIIFCCRKDDSTTKPSTKRMLGTAIQYGSNDTWLGKTLVGDMNGDNLEDVVIVESSGSNESILIYYQNLAGGLNTPVVKLADQIRGFAIGDVNGDNKNDLVVSGSSSLALSGYLGRIYLFYQNLSGDLLPYVEDTLSFNTTGDVAIGDINDDGRNDIAVLGDWTMDPAKGNISIFFQNANGMLAPEFIYNNSPVYFPGEIHIADMNNDGNMDIVFQSDMLKFAVLKQLSTRSFAALPDYYSVQTSYWPYFYAFATGDINGDNRNDVVVLDPGTNGPMNLFLQNTQGSLVLQDFVPVFSSSLNGVEIADIDEDGLNDILGDVVEYAVPPIGSINVFYQTINHTFETSAAYTFPTYSGGASSEHRSLAVGDVTGDGHKDVVVTWKNEGLFVLPSISKQ